ncbi:GtrA family protein [Corynebacterium ulceribovis]|uniref:GtrA family protein n=1 Tax=Corynebacterium ulceribovis TaxID=487732 RepID=UPI00037C5DF9|nr:GtrA family protein [Corynebacterium ulceribovis]
MNNPETTQQGAGLSLQVQATRFLITGIGAAVIDFGSTLIFQAFGIQRTWAKAMGWVLGTIAAYLMNRRWTFQSDGSWKKAAAVAVLYLTTFAVQVGLYKFTNQPLIDLGLDGVWKDTVSFVIAQGVATVVNFIVQRTVIFKVR